eukprot:scaffold1118_cov135-Cylindrotheca_fusiformis.AAC.12
MTDKRVDFRDIEILEFPYILGDNPAVSGGAPIALGNDLEGRTTLEVDTYESCRKKRKSRRKLVIPVHIRAQILLSKGYSLEAIATATLEADEINKGRMVSASKQSWDKVNEVSERFGRVFKKAMGKKQQVVANTA